MEEVEREHSVVLRKFEDGIGVYVFGDLVALIHSNGLVEKIKNCFEDDEDDNF